MEINNKTTQKVQGKSARIKTREQTYVHQISENWKFLLSEGCYIVRERANAKWLFDLILSYQSSTVLKGVGFQEWIVKKLGSSDVQVLCKNENREILIAKVLLVDRFPLAEVTIHIRDNLASLKSEKWNE